MALASHLLFNQLLTHCSHRPLDNLYSSCPSLIIPEKDIHKKRPNSFATYVKASSGSRFYVHSKHLLLKRNSSSSSRHLVRPDPRADRQRAPGELSRFISATAALTYFPSSTRKYAQRYALSLRLFLSSLLIHSLHICSLPSTSVFPHELRFSSLSYLFLWVHLFNCVLQSKGESWQDSRIGPVG